RHALGGLDLVGVEAAAVDLDVDARLDVARLGRLLGRLGGGGRRLGLALVVLLLVVAARAREEGEAGEGDDDTAHGTSLAGPSCHARRGLTSRRSPARLINRSCCRRRSRQ